LSDFIAHFGDWKPKRVHHFKGGLKIPHLSQNSVIVITKAYGAWTLYILSLEQASMWIFYFYLMICHELF
jgi:hypothetical protein